MVIQQGDVLLIQVPKAKGVTKQNRVEPKQRGYVLAEGEVTGHMHVIQELEGTELYQLSGDELLLHLEKESQLVHDDHKAATIPPGDYVVRKVREYDHFEEEARAVAD